MLRAVVYVRPTTPEMPRWPSL